MIKPYMKQCKCSMLKKLYLIFILVIDIGSGKVKIHISVSVGTWEHNYIRKHLFLYSYLFPSIIIFYCIIRNSVISI